MPDLTRRRALVVALLGALLVAAIVLVAGCRQGTEIAPAKTPTWSPPGWISPTSPPPSTNPNAL